MQTLTNAYTWKVISQPSHKNIIRSKWVFYIKQNADRSLEKYKAWLIARGFTLIYGVDYLDTYSPVAQFSSIYSASKNWSNVLYFCNV